MQHTLLLSSGETIPYQLERRIRRTVGLKITPQGLVVHAPKRIAQYQLETILNQKTDWILKKLKALQQNQLPPLQWQNGEQLLLLGNQMTLIVKHDTRSRAVSYSPGAPPLSFSAGVYQGWDEKLENLLRQADDNLYQAKADGRGRTVQLVQSPG